ncbi:hypothetical protein R3P38DRAFT_3283747 [Favolaschia claudopus]|uniref:Serine-threonine/tyrosine-protein kinase catalytic domain-containing protein n=1 Tax=Favolaschia claudopus TaxID=2862362 RepID=A0AAW0A725_9AGAR
MTVAIYEGSEKELKDEWDEYIALQTRLRHPNVLQLFGVANSQGLYAAIFHDEHKSFEQMSDAYSVTPTQRIYFRKFWTTEFEAHGPYIAFMINAPSLTPRSRSTSWFHRSGKLCLEVHSSRHKKLGANIPPSVLPNATIHSPKYLLPPAEVSRMIDFIDLELYHCRLSGMFESRIISLARHSSIRPYSIVKHVAGNLQEMAFLPQIHYDTPIWEPDVNGILFDKFPPNGWSSFLLSGNEMRCSSFQLTLTTDWMRCPWRNFNRYLEFRERFAWSAQANYIFGRPGMESSSCSYIDLILARYCLTSEIPPSLEIVLFLPPPWSFFSTDLTRCCFPKDEPYWSFDQSGKECLSSKEASDLGLPQIELEIDVFHHFVNEALLKDIRTFHTRKGFNPGSQEVAKHLGVQLYCFGDEGDPVPSPVCRPDFEDWGAGEDQMSDIHSGNTTPISDYMESDDDQILYPRIAPSI